MSEKVQIGDVYTDPGSVPSSVSGVGSAIKRKQCNAFFLLLHKETLPLHRVISSPCDVESMRKIIFV